MRFDAVLFDWGDTLVWVPALTTSPGLHLECVEGLHRALVGDAHGRCLARAGTDWPRFRAVYEDVCAEQLAYSRQTRREHRLEDRMTLALRGAGCECVLDEAEAAELARLFGRLLLERAHPVDGVHHVLRTLAARHRLGVVANCALAPLVHESLERFDLRRYFGTVVVSGALGWVKPDARPFRQALSDLGVDAGRAIVVGDDFTNDMQGGKAAGLTTAWLAPGRRRPEGDAIDHHLQALTELIEVVEGPVSPPA